MLIQSTPVFGGNGKCNTRCDPSVHHMQAGQSAGERTTQILKPMGRITWSKRRAISSPTKWTLVQQKIGLIDQFCNQINWLSLWETSYMLLKVSFLKGMNEI